MRSSHPGWLLVAGLIACEQPPTQPGTGQEDAPPISTAAPIGLAPSLLVGENTDATIATDRPDYLPGDTVIITGAGWESGEQVVLEFTETPVAQPVDTLFGYATTDGELYNNELIIQPSDTGQTFTLRAVGQSSGRIAYATFADNHWFLSPTTGPDLGGTALSLIRGCGFFHSCVRFNTDAIYSVSFGVSAPVPGQLLSSDHLRATTPPGPEGPVEVVIHEAPCAGCSSTVFASGVFFTYWGPVTQIRSGITGYTRSRKQCSPLLAITTHDSHGTLAAVRTDLVVEYVSSSATGGFYRDAACGTAPVSSITIAAGANSGGAYYSDPTPGLHTLTAKPVGLPPAAIEARILGDPARLVLDGLPSSMSVGSCPVFTLGLKDAAGQPATAPAEGITVALHSTSTGYQFRLRGTNFLRRPCENSVSTVRIASGASAVEVFYLDNAVGDWTLRADATINGATVTETRSLTVCPSGGCTAPGTTTDVAIEPNSPTYGQAVTVTATVSPTSGASTPTGEVTFYEGGTCQAAGGILAGPLVLSGGRASFTVATIPAGNHTIIACYGGAGGFGASAGSRPLTVSPAPLAIAPSDKSKIYGEPVPALDGVITGLRNDDRVAVTYVAGSGGLVTATSPAGEYPITVGQVTATAGNLANYALTRGEGTLRILKATPSFSGLSSPRIVLGTSSIVLSGVIGAGSGAYVVYPTGSVAVTVNGIAQQSTIGPDGTFSTEFVTVSLPVSPGHPVSYSYGGDHNFDPAAPAAATLKVTYPFQGFFQPVDNNGVYNRVTAGRAIPIKFRLGGDQGLDVFQAGSPVVQRQSCTSGPSDVIEETVAASTSGLTYDPLADQYSYVWKTQSSYTATCQKLVLITRDGERHEALFHFPR